MGAEVSVIFLRFLFLLLFSAFHATCLYLEKTPGLRLSPCSLHAFVLDAGSSTPPLIII
jgi:hypothetical protein